MVCLWGDGKLHFSIMSRIMKRILPSLFSSALLMSSAVNAGGIYIYEIATNDVGLASAGVAARAHDASVMATNPAGLSNIKGSSFSGGIQALYGDTNYQLADGSSTGDIVGFMPLASAFYSQEVNDRLSLGVGVFGNYGMSLEYDNFLISEATTQALTLSPSASYTINEQWALGATIGVHYGMLSFDAQMLPYGHIEADDTDVAYNATLGLLYTPTNQTRVGLAYASETTLEFDGGLLGPQKSVMPQHVTLSAYHELNTDWAIMGNLGWQDWSEFQTFTQSKTQDTYQIAIGARYQINSQWLWNVGAAFDTSLYKNQSQGDFTIPTGKAWRIGTGIERKLDNTSTIGLAFEAVLMESSSMQNANFGQYGYGKFERPALYFLTATYTWSEQ